MTGYIIKSEQQAWQARVAIAASGIHDEWRGPLIPAPLRRLNVRYDIAGPDL